MKTHSDGDHTSDDDYHCGDSDDNISISDQKPAPRKTKGGRKAAERKPASGKGKSGEGKLAGTANGKRKGRGDEAAADYDDEEENDYASTHAAGNLKLNAENSDDEDSDEDEADDVSVSGFVFGSTHFVKKESELLLFVCTCTNHKSSLSHLLILSFHTQYSLWLC